MLMRKLTVTKKRQQCTSLLIGLLVAVLVIGFVSSASATTLTFGLNEEFSGGDVPESTTLPWVTITLDDSVVGGNEFTVRMTANATNLTGGGPNGENINSFLLNFDPSLDASLLAFNVVNNGDSVPTGITGANDSFMADGDGFFDIEFMMPPPTAGVASRFTRNETIIYDLVFPSPISAASFQFLSVMGGGQGQFLAAAQIQGIGDGGSGWIGVIPEPNVAVLLGLGMIGLSWRGRQVRESD